MTNEIATLNESSIAVLPPAQPPSLAARQMLLSHAEMMQTAYQLAQGLCNTQMVPARFRGKAEDGAAAILYGAELGLNPIQSLQRIVPIHGMPTLEARTMVALLKSRGYKVKTLEQSDDQVSVEGFDLAGERYVSQWTMERAIKAEYVPEMDERTGKYKTNANGKLIGNAKYLTDPQAMLKAKAQAEVCRDMAPDILLGISYTSEEMESERFDEPPARARAQVSAPITVEEIFNPPATAAEESEQPEQRTEQPDSSEQAPSTAEPIPEREQAIAEAQAQIGGDTTETGSDPDPDEPDEPAAPAQNRKMHALFRDAACTERSDRLAVTSAILGFSIDTSAKLTKTEASRIIDELDTWQSRGELGEQVSEILNRAALNAENLAVDDA